MNRPLKEKLDSTRLELSSQEFDRQLQTIGKELSKYLDNLATSPTNKPEPEIDPQFLAIENSGTAIESIVEPLFSQVIDGGLNPATPGFLGYIPGGGLPHSALADLIGDITNNYSGLYSTAPGVVKLEEAVINWLCNLFDYPKQSHGVLLSGGSMANFTAVVTAREELVQNDLSRACAYTSAHTHYSTAKALRLAGIPKENLRSITVDESFSINCQNLEKTIEKDIANGLKPFLIVASAGTTNTGAIDNMLEIHRISRKFNLWMHVDAAYGGFFYLVDEGKDLLNGISSADSITLDPHKGMFLPYGTGALIVKNRQNLYNAFKLTSEVLPEFDDSKIDYCHLSPELTRDWRGLRIWLPLKIAGVETFKSLIREKLQLTELALNRLKEIPEIELLTEPELTVIAFRYLENDLSTDQLNEANKRLIELINNKKRVYLSGTTIDGSFIIRVCILSFRTHAQQIDWLIEDIKSSIRELK